MKQNKLSVQKSLNDDDNRNQRSLSKNSIKSRNSGVNIRVSTQLERIPEFEILCTRLKLIITESDIEKHWESDKPRNLIIQYLQELFSQDKKDPKEKFRESRTSMAQNPQVKYNKSPITDLQNFKNLIIKHTKHDPPHAIAMIPLISLEKIKTYVKNSYFANYELYNKTLLHKQKNEEINFYVTVDTPTYVPPLTDALYIGKPKLEIGEEEDEEQDQDTQLRNQQNQQQSVQQGNVVDSDEEQVLPTKILTKEEIEKLKFEELVSTRLDAFKEDFGKTLLNHEEKLMETYDDLLNPKKKK